ncbi:helix-turn-helix transcriptional regulator [Cellulosimicrobium cellulans]|uniref:helix-turn-helix transcriptional regulator n=1 Tax=Cellulosimicrobium cellulans TaxID=1710 RepID=UPI0024070C48|nr:helix-turn-helix domain-containing protein [Cellulosimicrobium cellulans]MDF9874808.1 excisionase family DNA binding protein [Cellulosimicrobium cellulans]
MSILTTTRLMTELEAGEYLGVPSRTLRNWRYLGTGPAFVKVGRAVRYRMTDLEAYVEAQTFTRTDARA